VAAWIPLLKTALPYVAQVLSVAIPAFTSKAGNKTSDIIPEQIKELQSAVIQNAESVKTLAEHLKGTIEGVDSAAIKLQQEVVSLKRQCLITLIIAGASLAIAVWAILSR